MPTLQDLLNELDDLANEADNIIENSPPPTPPLESNEKTSLGTKLDDAETKCTDIINDLSYTGSARASGGGTLQNLASETVTWAGEMKTENLGNNDSDYIGTRAKGLKDNTIPAYRTAAGI